MKLNHNQQQVIDHNNGPLLIVAGAGTGKTTAITQKIAHAITSNHLDSERIFAATFTQKSASEMINRLDDVMPLGYEEPWVGTFHSLCDRILKAEAINIGLDPNYQILTNTNQWILIKQNLFSFNLEYFRPLGNPAKFISSILTFFSRIQDESVSDQELDKYLSNKINQANTSELKEEADKLKELFAAYQKYQQLKIEQSVLDFGDLITQTIHLFQTRPAILQKYQQQFKYIFVDEFQDTNFAQYELIKLMAPDKNNPNLIVVGDDDQSIYKFRGASVSNILGFKADYPKAKEIILTENYRSPQNLLDSSYQLIQNNNPDRLEAKLGINKKLVSHQPDIQNNQRIIEVPTQIDEVEYAITQIISLVSTNKYTFKDFAILARANAQLQPFALGLKRAGIPYQLVAGKGLFDQSEIRLLINFLEVVTDPTNDLVLFEFLHSPLYSLEGAQILSYIQTAKKLTKPLWEVITDQEECKPIIDIITSYQNQIKQKSTSQILFDFIISSHFIHALTREETVENSLKIKNINLFFEKVKTFENEQPHSTILEFMQTLKLWEEAGENPAQATIEDIDTVNLMTIHASKGLEFATVFITNLVTGRFPTSNRRDLIDFPPELIKEQLPQGNTNVQEERRLMYVGMTRAKQHLIMTYALDYGGVRKRKPSGFLSETTGETTNWQSDKTGKFFENPAPPSTTHLTKQGRVEIKSLSYTQIDTFKGCPLKYKYRYILKIPTLPYHTLTFGRSVHETLYEFHRLAQQGKKLSQAEFLELFDQHFDEVGYENQVHKQERYQKAVIDLKKYYQHHTKLFGQPIHLERSFKLKIADVVINGKIDRIDEKAGQYEIIDYKTGQAKDQKKVDKDDQLSLYALAANEVFNINPQKLSLYFIESGDKVETTRSQAQLQKTKQKLESDINAMKTSDFPPKPDKVRCGFCEYNRICPFRADK